VAQTYRLSVTQSDHVPSRAVSIITKDSVTRRAPQCRRPAASTCGLAGKKTHHGSNNACGTLAARRWLPQALALPIFSRRFLWNGVTVRNGGNHALDCYTKTVTGRFTLQQLLSLTLLFCFVAVYVLLIK